MGMDDRNRHREQDARAGADADAPELSLEQEVIVLCSAYEQIGSMVSARLIDLSGSRENAQYRFWGSPHQELFFILLVDFLAKTASDGPLQTAIYLLDGLWTISGNPQLPHGGPTRALEQAADKLNEWLQRPRSIDLWMPTIARNATLTMTTNDMIVLYGNSAKHSSLRTSRIARQLNGILNDAGLDVAQDQLQPALSDFYMWSDEHLLPFYGNQLFELLNNVRVGIHTYARPEFDQSYHWIGEYDPVTPRYSYHIPSGIQSTVARSSYWNLMNRLRYNRHARAFTISEYLRGNPIDVTDVTP